MSRYHLVMIQDNRRKSTPDLRKQPDKKSSNENRKSEAVSLEELEEQIIPVEAKPLESFETIQDDFLKFGGYVSAEQLLLTVQPGDCIEFYRLGYLHYALYLGDGKVMNTVANLYSDEAKIKKMLLQEVVKASGVRICNHDDLACQKFDMKKKPTKEIITSAKLFENQTVPYELFGRNCEYYATLWRYGVGFSTQVLSTERSQGGATAIEALRNIPEMLPNTAKSLLKPGVAWVEDVLTTQREVASYEMYKNLANKAKAMKSIRDSFSMLNNLESK